jgi:hypothetical protein
VTPAPTPLFGGRDPDLQRVATTFTRGRAVVLAGPDGAGKSELAVEFVHRYGRFFAGGVFWLSFAIAEDVALQVAACGGDGGMQLRADFTDLALDDQLHLVLRAWQADTPRLLVFDDCDDPEVLREWLPSGGGAHVLVTSRRAVWDGALRVDTVPVGSLPREEGAALLRRHRHDIPASSHALRQIAEELEDLPLALHVAGGILRRHRTMTPESLLEQLGSREVVDRAAVLLGENEPPGPATRNRFGRRGAPGQGLLVRARHAGPAGRPARIGRVRRRRGRPWPADRPRPPRP